jgi:hypothetical protein
MGHVDVEGAQQDADPEGKARARYEGYHRPDGFAARRDAADLTYCGEPRIEFTFTGSSRMPEDDVQNLSLGRVSRRAVSNPVVGKRAVERKDNPVEPAALLDLDAA